MNQTCPYCGVKTNGAPVCPSCGGTIARVEARGGGYFHEDPRQALTQKGLLLIGGSLAVCIAVLLISQRVATASENPQSNTTVAALQASAPGDGTDSLSDLPSAQTPTDTPLPADLVNQPASADVKPGAAAATKPAALGSEATPVPIPQTTEDGTVQLKDADMTFQTDVDGNSYGLGYVTLVNNGDGDITDFRMTLDSGNGEFQLVPYDGSADDPNSLQNRTIPPGGQLRVPVMFNGGDLNWDPNQPMEVRVRANRDGDPNAVAGDIAISSGQ